MNILLILLGCNISYLLNDRIHAAVKFARHFNDTNVNWFLSGGIKNPHEDTMTEAEKMALEISKHAKHGKWNYIYDKVATNTAENFIMVKKYLEDKQNHYSEVYIVTSDFHQMRAKQIAAKIIGMDIKWILGDAELEDSRYWENIHIRNVDADVYKAINKFRT